MPRKKKPLNTQSQTANYESRNFNPIAYFWFNRDQIPFFLGMVDLMLLDEQVWFGLNISNAPFQSAEVSVTSPDEEVAQFVKEQFDRIWATSHDKILRAKIYGYGGYEVVYKENKGLWEFLHLKDFHHRDIFPLLYPKDHPFAGHRCGMRVKHVDGDPEGQVDLQSPNCLWLSFNAKYGSNFGESCLMRAYDPWKQKCLDGGAKGLLKQFFFKHAFLGIRVRYPEGRVTQLPDGTKVSGRDLAREIMDMLQYGSAIALPSNTDEHGNKEYDIEAPMQVAGDTQLLEYIKDLDHKILKGIVIPQEIVEAGGTGSGYSGRSFPMSVFLLARDVEFTSYVRELNQQIIYPLTVLNFGCERADYDIEPRSFLETFGEAMGDSELGDKDKNQDDKGIDFDDGDFPGDDDPDDPDSNRGGIQFSTSTAEKPKSSSKGTWITIGAQAGEDGKKHGGVPVKIDGRGRIIAGPSKFVGTNIKKLKTDKSKLGRHESAIHETAHKHRIKRSELHEVAQQIWQDKRQAIEEREAAKAQVRKTTGMTQQDIIRLENQGKDHTAVKGFDAVARQVAGEYPELGLGRGYEQDAGYDDTDYASKLWDLLREGKQVPPAKHDERLLNEAAEIVKENKKYKNADLDEVPFAIQFSAQHAPEGGVTVQGQFYPGGQFIPGDVIAKATKAEKEAIKGKKKKQKGMFDEEDDDKPEFELEREPEKKITSDKFDNTDKTKQKKLLDGLDALPGQQDLFEEKTEEPKVEAKPEEPADIFSRVEKLLDNPNLQAKDKERILKALKEVQAAQQKPEEKKPEPKVEVKPVEVQKPAEQPEEPKQDPAQQAAVSAAPKADPETSPVTPPPKESVSDWTLKQRKLKEDAYNSGAWKKTHEEYRESTSDPDYSAYRAAIRKAIEDGETVPAKVLDQGDGEFRQLKQVMDWRKSLSDDQRRIMSSKLIEVTEDDYLEKKRLEKINNLRQGLFQNKQELKKLGPKATNKRMQLESQLRVWKQMLDGYESMEHGGDENNVNASGWRQEYRETIKAGISKGLITDDKILDQHPEFRKARDARERYEKGVHTSFANQSLAVNDSMKKKLGYKAKRQDGKPLTKAQLDELEKGVGEISTAIGSDLADIFNHTDVTLAHTSGKHPFLSTAVGMYHPEDRTVTSGTELHFGPLKHKFKSLAHEIGHFLDFEAGRAAGMSDRVYRKNKHFTSSAVSELDHLRDYQGRRNSFIGKARDLMAHKQEARQAMKDKLNKTLDPAENIKLQGTKLSLGPYYESEVEIWARLFEQYVGSQHGNNPDNVSHKSNYHDKPAYWSEKDFETLKPMVKAEIDRRLKMIRDKAAAQKEKSGSD